MQSYVPLMILFLVAAAITVGIFTLTSIIGPKNPTAEKMIPFECGSESTEGRFVKHDPRSAWVGLSLPSALC